MARLVLASMGIALLLVGAAPAGWAEGVITPGTIDFGRQAQGTQSASRTIELVNTGRNPFSVYRGELNSGPDNADFVATKDGCTGATVEPGAGCTVELAFKPLGVGRTSQTFGFDVSGADYRTLGERVAVMTLNGEGTPSVTGSVPSVTPARDGPPSRTASVPAGLYLPVIGVAALGFGLLIMSSTRRAEPG